MASTGSFHFDNSFARELAGFYTPWQAAVAPSPRLVFLDRALAADLGLDVEWLEGPDGTAILAGNTTPEGAQPIAQAYAGHQFGHFSPQLGDGRALLLGEVLDVHGQRRDIAFKGSGRTPYARGGDGKAALGPMLREVLVSESMHALGIPTTRALAVVATGERVIREQVLPGAVLTRVAASHLRVGTFELYASRGDTASVRKLADYAIARHYPALAQSPQPYLALLGAVVERQAALIAQWMNVGFIHGVMNTDNMTISGETIDYGPCAFMEAYDPATVFSSIDSHGRYAFGNQPDIALWNVTRFAETLLPLLADDIDAAAALATGLLETFQVHYRACLLRGQRAKLGLVHASPADDPADAALADEWLALLEANAVDFTLAWRHLGDAAAGNDAPLRAMFGNGVALDAWLGRWQARCEQDDQAAAVVDRASAMRAANPLFIARNHRVEEALAAASGTGDLAPFVHLLDAIRQPYDDSPANAPYAAPAPAAVTARYRTFCGT